MWLFFFFFVVIFSMRMLVLWPETAVGRSETFDRWTECRIAPNAAPTPTTVCELVNVTSVVKLFEESSTLERSNRRSIYQVYRWKCPAEGSISQKSSNGWLVAAFLMIYSYIHTFTSLKMRGLCFTHVHDSVTRKLTNRMSIWTLMPLLDPWTAGINMSNFTDPHR